jgi:four helix bundle protein
MSCLHSGMMQNDENAQFDFEGLVVWQKSKLLKIKVRMITKKMPEEERFRLVNQLVRSSRSICALLAEGNGRFTYKDKLHFCIQARGSLFETVNHLMDAYDEGFISSDELTSLKSDCKELERILNGYIVYLRKERDLKPTSNS